MSAAIAIQPQTPSPPLAATFVQHPPTIDGCERLRSAQLTLAADEQRACGLAPALQLLLTESSHAGADAGPDSLRRGGVVERAAAAPTTPPRREE